MIKNLLVLKITIWILIEFCCCAHLWGYKGPHGPQDWGQFYPTCDQSSQSPIDIKHDQDLVYKMETPLQFFNYHQIPDKVKITNDGHLKTVFPTAAPMLMYGGGLTTAYKFHDIHIHWGSHNHLGSEHKVDGRSFPVEFHFVHYKAQYDSLSQALENPEHDTLAVLGVFGEIVEEDNPRLAPLLDHLAAVESSTGEEMDIPGFAANSILPENHDRFYRYSGSLTTPGCFEVVSWTVSRTVIPISESQMNKLRALMLPDHSPQMDNNRPVQQLNKRKVYDVETFLHHYSI